MKTLALCMVVKNEEKGLARAIESCQKFVQEIHILVDSSSSDDTFKIAQSFTHNVKIFKWNDNFSEARNMASKYVKSDYILFIDGHEFVVQCEGLQEVLALGSDVFFTKIRMDNGSVFSAPRIYKNGLQFEGAVHERLIFDNAGRYDTFLIQHDRLGGQAPESAKIREQQRDEQIPRIMCAQLKENKKDIRASFHLMLYYQSRSDYKKALYYSKKYLKYSPDEQQRWFVYYSRSLCHLALGNLWRSFWAIHKANFELSDRWENYKMMGLIFFERGQYEKSLENLVNSLTPNKKHYAYEPLPFDNAGTFNLMGECFFRRGVYDKASIAFGQASERATDMVQKIFFKKRSELMEKMAVAGRD